MIPFVDVSQSFARIADELEPALREIFASGAFVQGRWVQRFEEDFAHAVETRHAIAVSSGTEALRLSLAALGLQPGDEVITTPFTFFATTEAILALGAQPRFVDVDPRTLQLDSSLVESALTERSVGILPVHLYGSPAELAPLVALAEERGLWLVEDACQAHGARLAGRPLGSVGNTGCFSFYPGKNLGGCGEGGMIVTQDDELAEQVRLLRDHGASRKYEHLVVGTNARMSELCAASLALKLPYLDTDNVRRREIAARYARGLAGLPLEPVTTTDEALPVHHLYVVRTTQRDALREFLGSLDIQTGLHYPIPLHRQPALEASAAAAGEHPNAERAADSVLSLPMFPQLTNEQVDAVCRGVQAFFAAAPLPRSAAARVRDFTLRKAC